MPHKWGLPDGLRGIEDGGAGTRRDASYACLMAVFESPLLGAVTYRCGVVLSRIG